MKSELQHAKAILRILKAIKETKDKMEDLRRDLDFQYGRLVDSGYPIDRIDMRDSETDLDYGEPMENLIAEAEQKVDD
jgi:hypothetical protein